MNKHMPNQEQSNTEENKDNMENPIDNLNTLLTTANELFKQIGSLGKIFASELKNSDIEPKKLSLLTYKNVIEYFSEPKPDDPTIVQGAIIKEKQGSDYLILQLFLTEDYQMVSSPSGKIHGRRLVTEKLDDELIAAFKNKNIILVK
jgi:hypothetical protein